jgi:hypothetical protein
MDIPNKFCHNCGTKQASAGAKFCFSCGTSLASIDEKPPVVQQRQPPQRVNPQPQDTFEPSVLGAGRGGRRGQSDDDYDDVQIRADRVESLSELGIRMNDLDIVVDVERVRGESFANVVRSGIGLNSSYQEPPRAAGSNGDVKQILGEGSAIRPSTSTEIK